MRTFHLNHAWRLAVLLLLAAAMVGCQGSGPRGPGELMRDAFNVYSPDLRREAIDKLSAAPYGGEPVHVRVYRLSIDDADASVRASAAKALGLHGAPEDVALIAPLLEAEAAFERWEAAKALKKLHHDDAVSPLASVVQDDEDADVRQAAAHALGQYRTGTAFQALIGALHDTNHGVARAARASLTTLTGVDQGTEARDWLSWADEQRNGEGLFANARPYTYQPWTPIPGYFEQLLFGDPLLEPRHPAGWSG